MNIIDPNLFSRKVYFINHCHYTLSRDKSVCSPLRAAMISPEAKSLEGVMRDRTLINAYAAFNDNDDLAKEWYNHEAVRI